MIVCWSATCLSLTNGKYNIIKWLQANKIKYYLRSTYKFAASGFDGFLTSIL